MVVTRYGIKSSPIFSSNKTALQRSFRAPNKRVINYYCFLGRALARGAYRTPAKPSQLQYSFSVSIHFAITVSLNTSLAFRIPNGGQEMV